MKAARKQADIIDHREAARGHALKPMVMADMERKFMDCCAATAYENPKRLLARLQSFETLADVGAAVKAGAAAA